MILHRLGEKNRQQCLLGRDCPQVLRSDDGHFVFVGKLVTGEVSGKLPPGPGIGAGEGAVKIPCDVVAAALPEIAAA